VLDNSVSTRLERLQSQLLAPVAWGAGTCHPTKRMAVVMGKNCYNPMDLGVHYF
jgi:hypothetical protein